jgi:hypothetical protein
MPGKESQQVRVASIFLRPEGKNIFSEFKARIPIGNVSGNVADRYAANALRMGRFFILGLQKHVLLSATSRRNSSPGTFVGLKSTHR